MITRIYINSEAKSTDLRSNRRRSTIPNTHPLAKVYIHLSSTSRIPILLPICPTPRPRGTIILSTSIGVIWALQRNIRSVTMIVGALSRIVVAHLISSMRKIHPNTHGFPRIAITAVCVPCGKAFFDGEAATNPLCESCAYSVADSVGCELGDGTAGIGCTLDRLGDLLVQTILGW